MNEQSTNFSRQCLNVTSKHDLYDPNRNDGEKRHNETQNQRGTKRNQSTDEQKRVLKNTDGTTKSPLQTREPTDSVRSTPTPAGRRNRQKKRTDAFRRTD